jgi:cytochrome c oxidase assembly factor CtaG
VIALALVIATVAVYCVAVVSYKRKYPNREFSFFRIAAFVSGCALLAASLLPWADTRADTSFAAHMLQHIVMLLIAPPLILLGAPLLLAVAVPRNDVARKIAGFGNTAFGHALFAPVTAWLLYVFVLWGAHFSPLYELALEHPAVHVLEHLLFVGSALLFWNAVVQIGYAPRPVPYAARMFYLFLAIPQGAFLGFALNATRTVLYPHYEAVLGSAALPDQHSGADMMWLAGGFLLFAAFMCTAGAWAAAERRAPGMP